MIFSLLEVFIVDFDDLPDSWAVATINDICDIQTGKKDVNQGNPEGKYYFFTCAAEPLRSDEYTFEGESILLPGNGANVGLVLYYDGKFDLYQRTYVLNNFSIYGKFLYYYLLSFWEYSLINKQYGSATNYIRLSNITQMQIRIAPLNEQKRIVEKIELIQERTKIVKRELENIKVLLKKLRRSLLASAFRGDLTKDWRANHPDIEPAEVLLERMKKNSTQKKQKSDNRKLPDPFKIIENWQWVTLFDICTSITDGDHQAPPKTKEGVPFLVISNINKGNLDFSNTRYVPEDYYEKIQEHRKPQQGDIIYSVVGSYGIPVLIETDRKFCFQRHIALFKINPLMNNHYLLYALKSDFVYNQATDVATGTAQLTVSLTELRKIKIPLAPLEEQKEIVRKLEKMMKFADQVEERVKEAEEKLNKFNQSVLAKAFRGKLVPQDPNDEPASVLLGKIQQEKNKTTIKKTKK